MTVGLEIYNDDGSVAFGVTDRAFKKAGEVLIGANDSGSVAIPELGDPNYTFGYMVRPAGGITTASNYSPNVTLNGITVSWSPSNVRFQSPARPVILEYGFF
ncbi:hypothetical protein [Sphingomonas sp. RIT328]|uniref:hypothetical protein n=1 Tax=Sphingomonas sp. RIT328 TaxID=1470591 RepID=UPI0004498AC0|nr:hypothetical protein [Sphingomonas sp. RIT328]EZP57423.1 hypothetical protein BW41_00268 [Sphingomonas sp. RIT328]